MTLQEVFEQLTYGELSQLSIGGGAAGELSDTNYPRILPHVNLGLTALYKRFPLKEGRVVVGLMTDVVTYNIHSKYAFTNAVPATPGNYLIDTVDNPFTDDVLKIERVLTDDDFEMQINDLSDFYSVFTPTATTLRVPVDIVNQAMLLPDWLKTENLELVYRANHPKIVIDSGYLDPTTVELELPDSYLEPLLLFIASRAMSPLGTGQFEGLAGNNYFAKYEQACQQIELKNLQVDQGSQNIRLFQAGWV